MRTTIMETLIHADVFFFISTIALVIVTIALLIALFYIIKLVRNIERISESLKEGAEEVGEQIRDKGIASFVLGLAHHKKGKKSHAKE